MFFFVQRKSYFNWFSHFWCNSLSKSLFVLDYGINYLILPLSMFSGRLKMLNLEEGEKFAEYLRKLSRKLQNSNFVTQEYCVTLILQFNGIILDWLIRYAILWVIRLYLKKILKKLRLCLLFLNLYIFYKEKSYLYVSSSVNYYIKTSFEIFITIFYNLFVFLLKK